MIVHDGHENCRVYSAIHSCSFPVYLNFDRLLIRILLDKRRNKWQSSLGMFNCVKQVQAL
jgi:hypothetical protein